MTATTGPTATPPRTRRARPSVRWLLVGLVLAAAVPAVVGLVVRPTVYAGDNPLIEMGVRRVLDGSPPDVGVYSRYGWYHPGPVLYYLLAPPYLLLGGTSWSLQVATLGLNVLCLLGVVLLLRRLRGTVVALGGLAVTLLYLHLLPPYFVSDYWNVYLPVLPFLLACVLCWAAVDGLRWGLPAAGALLAACVQMHVGYLVAAAGLLLATGGLLLLRRLRDGRGAGPSRRSAVLGAVAVGLMWAPPVVQQLTGDPGNLGRLISDISRSDVHPTVAAAWAMVGSELGKLPAFLVGVEPHRRVLLPPGVPAWTAWLAVAVLVVAGGVALRRADRTGVAGVVLAATTVAAAVAAAARVRGVLFDYLVQWMTVAAILTWTAVLGVVAARLGPRVPHRGPVRAGAAVLVLVTVALAGTDVPQRDAGRPDVQAAGRAAAAWATANDVDVVELALLPQTRPRFLGLLAPGTGVCLELARAGVGVRVPPELAFSTGNVLPVPTRPAQAVLAVGEVGNVESIPPDAAVVAQDGAVLVVARRVSPPAG